LWAARSRTAGSATGRGPKKEIAIGRILPHLFAWRACPTLTGDAQWIGRYPAGYGGQYAGFASRRKRRSAGRRPRALLSDMKSRARLNCGPPGCRWSAPGLEGVLQQPFGVGDADVLSVDKDQAFLGQL